MATLTNTKIKDTYDGLLKTADNDIVGASEKNITDGLGNATVLSIGTASASFSSDVEVNGLTIGKGANDVSTNTALGFQTLDNATGGGNTAVGYAALLDDTTGVQNTALGVSALRYNTTGSYNVAIGSLSLDDNVDGSDNVAVGYSSLGFNTSGSQNVAIGRQALLANTTGGSNTAIGYTSLAGNITGINNTAVGRSSLYANTGSYNTAFGAYALTDNTTGANNVAIGYNALVENLTGLYNTAVGVSSLGANVTGGGNVAIGYFSLRNNTASNNTAIGLQSMTANTTGDKSVAVGNYALNSNTDGGQNTAVGSEALKLNTSGSNITAIGRYSMGNATAGNNNTAVGFYSLVDNQASNNVAIGDLALRYNTTGFQNSALGSSALRDNTTGAKNTALGESALANNLTSDSNTAVGYRALYLNEGAYNTAIGSSALDNNATGSFNSVMGYNTLGTNSSGSYNTAIGNTALQSDVDGDRNVALGYGAGYNKTSGDGNIYIGYQTQGGSTTSTNEIVIGQNATGNGSNTATYGNGNITDHYFTAGNVHVVGDLTVGGTMPSSDLDLTGTPYGEGDILTVSSSGTLTKIDKDSAAEYLGVNSKTLMKDLSFGESYVNNFRSRVIDNTGTYFPTPSGYNFGVMKNKGLVDKMGVMLLPSGVKSGGLFSVKPSNGNGDFDFTRASTATYVDEDGLIAVAPTGTPRLDYPLIDGVVQDTPSLLLEPSRTNYVTQSENFSDAAWNKTNITVTSNNSISPDGSQNADLLTSTGSGSYIDDPISIQDPSAVSVFVKYIDQQYIQLYSGASGSFYANFDIKNKEVGTTGSITSDAKIEDYGNGWLRLSAIFSGVSGGSTYRIGFAQSISSSWGGLNTSTGGSVLMWGAELQNGSYATSYIPTSGSTATRAAETCNGAGTSADFNDSEGVLFAEISALANDGTFRMIGICDNNTSTNEDRIQIYFRTDANKISFLIEANDTNEFVKSIDIDDAMTSNKAAIQYGNTSKAFINGFKVAEETGVTTPNNLSRLTFEEQDGTDPFYGNTKQLITFKQALTDAELEDLTSWDSFSEMAEAQQYQTV